MNKTDEFELGITEPTRDELVARIEALEAQHREDASAIAVLGADREAAMKASAAALREVDALKARIEALEAENTNLVKLRDGLVEILRAVAIGKRHSPTG